MNPGRPSPTVEKIRQQLGSGSPNTITPLLDAWWRRLSSRLDAGPQALHRLPEAVIHAAERLWLTCLEQARVRAHQELSGMTGALNTKHSEQDLRAEVLRLQEQELTHRLADRDKTMAVLESETKAFAALFKKEQAKSAAEARRIVALQTELDALRKLLASMSVRMALKPRAVQRTTSTLPTRTAAKSKTKKTTKRRASTAARKNPQRPQTRGKAKRSARPRS